MESVYNYLRKESQIKLNLLLNNLGTTPINDEPFNIKQVEIYKRNLYSFFCTRIYREVNAYFRLINEKDQISEDLLIEQSKISLLI
jgi:hypothetical protein